MKTLICSCFCAIGLLMLNAYATYMPLLSGPAALFLAVGLIAYNTNLLCWRSIAAMLMVTLSGFILPAFWVVPGAEYGLYLIHFVLIVGAIKLVMIQMVRNETEN